MFYTVPYWNKSNAKKKALSKCDASKGSQQTNCQFDCFRVCVDCLCAGINRHHAGEIYIYRDTTQNVGERCYDYVEEGQMDATAWDTLGFLVAAVLCGCHRSFANRRIAEFADSMVRCAPTACPTV